MTEEQIALAKRAVACKGWRWMRGMSNDRGQTIDCVDLIQGKAYCGEWDADMTALPDLTDPATLGCLLALVREAHRCSEAHVYYATVSRFWVARWGRNGLGQWTVDAHTEADALVAALEAAP